MITFNCDFEKYYLGNGAFKRYAPLPEDFPCNPEHRWSLDKKVFRKGKQSLRIECRPNDIGGNGNERAELRGMLDAKGNDILEQKTGITKFIGFSVMLDKKYQPPAPNKKGEEGHQTLIQLHQIAEGKDFDDVHPAIALNVTDRFFVKISARELNGEPLKNNVFEFTPMGKKLLLGKWIDFVLEIKFAIDETGYVKIWRRNEGEKNYSLIFNKFNITTLHWDKTIKPKRALEHTWHLGVYRSPQYKTAAPKTTIVNYDCIVRADSLNEIIKYIQ